MPIQQYAPSSNLLVLTTVEIDQLLIIK